MLSSTVLRLRTFVLVALMVMAVLAWQPGVATSSIPEERFLSVQFLDVGQGDGILITTPDGYELIVDGGPDASILQELAQQRSYFDQDIDVVIATHPDADHVTGLIEVLARYDVQMIIETASQYDTTVAGTFQSAVEAEGAEVITARAGQVLQLGASTTVRILSPQGDSTNWETNTASVVVQVVYGDTEFMLTGDAPEGIEKYLMRVYGDELKSDVLKLGHHGSDTSSSKLFLELVEPQFAVVSAGEGNRYGHPHNDVIARASAAGAQIVSTAEDGTLTFYSDGVRVWEK